MFFDGNPQYNGCCGGDYMHEGHELAHDLQDMCMIAAPWHPR